MSVNPEGDFFLNRKKQEEEYLEVISKTFGELRQVMVPMMDRDVRGLDMLGQLSGLIGEPLWG
jgi:anion-transporting  ArsA/GET3 family ATPase